MKCESVEKEKNVEISNVQIVRNKTWDLKEPSQSFIFFSVFLSMIYVEKLLI